MQYLEVTKALGKHKMSEDMLILKKGGDIMSLGDRLRNLRQIKKHTLKEQSEILGVSLNSVYRWEHDLTTPRKSMLKTMADSFNVSLEWLLLESIGENDLTNSDHSPIEHVEKQLVSLFRKLNESNKYKVLGYIEHMCVEDYRI